MWTTLRLIPANSNCTTALILALCGNPDFSYLHLRPIAEHIIPSRDAQRGCVIVVAVVPRAAANGLAASVADHVARTASRRLRRLAGRRWPRLRPWRTRSEDGEVRRGGTPGKGRDWLGRRLGRLKHNQRHD